MHRNFIGFALLEMYVCTCKLTAHTEPMQI